MFLKKWKKSRSQAKINRVFGWTRWMRKWVKTLNNNIHADFLKVHLKSFLLLYYLAPFRLLGVSLDSFELSFLILWIISTQDSTLYKTIWNNTSLYNKSHLDTTYDFFMKLKIVSSLGVVSIFFAQTRSSDTGYLSFSLKYVHLTYVFSTQSSIP